MKLHKLNEGDITGSIGPPGGGAACVVALASPTDPSDWTPVEPPGPGTEVSSGIDILTSSGDLFLYNPSVWGESRSAVAWNYEEIPSGVDPASDAIYQREHFEVELTDPAHCWQSCGQDFTITLAHYYNIQGRIVRVTVNAVTVSDEGTVTGSVAVAQETIGSNTSDEHVLNTPPGLPMVLEVPGLLVAPETLVGLIIEVDIVSMEEGSVGYERRAGGDLVIESVELA